HADRLARALELAAPVLARVEGLVGEVVGALDSRVAPVVGHLVGAGGKRLRPLLVALAGQVWGARDGDLAELGAATERVHTATLLHDDVIDDGEQRRDRPTANALWGKGPPVLSGDFLYARVFRRLLQLGHLEALHALALAVESMVAGELLQLELRGDARIRAA